MKKLTYQNAAAAAIKEFDQCRKAAYVKEIERGAQFRRIDVMESSGNADCLSHVLFCLQFCAPEGDNYREVYIGIDLVNGKIMADLRLYTISAC